MSGSRDILLFEVGTLRYGCAVRDVSLIGAGAADLEAERVLETSLGSPTSGIRSLVVECPGGKRELVIDQVIGVRSVPAEALRELPEAAVAWLPTRAVRGLALLDDAITLIIDLPVLLAGGVAGPGPEELLHDAN